MRWAGSKNPESRILNPVAREGRRRSGEDGSATGGTEVG